MDVFIKNKSFRKIAFANFFSIIGDKLFYLAMLTYVSTLPQAQTAIALVTVSELLPQMFASLTGYWADNTEARGKYIIFADLVRMFLYFVVGILFISNVKGWVILVSIVVLNLISDFWGSYSSGLRQPLIVQVTGKEEFAQATGFNQSMAQILSVIAQFVGAALLLILTYGQLAFLNALTFFISGILMFFFFSQNQSLAKKQFITKNSHNADGYIKSLQKSLKILKAEKQIVGIVGIIVLLNGMLAALEPMIQMLLVNNQEMLIQNYSFTLAILNTTISVGLALGGLFGISLLKNVRLETLVLTCLLATAIFYPVLLLNNIWGILLLMLPICFLVGTIIPKLSGWLVNAVSQDRLAMTAGMLNTVLGGVAPLIAFIIITISSTLSPAAAVTSLFLVSLLLIIYQGYQLYRKYKTTSG